MLRDPECEADDLISVVANRVGDLIEQGRGRNLPRPLAGTIVVSDDKDMYQTLSPTNRVWRATMGKLVTPELFRSDHGFGAELYDSYKALVGEPATGDDIPGVTGIGDVNAAKMVGAHGDLEKLILVADQMVKSPKCPKTYANLYRERNQARLSRTLSKTAVSVPDLEGRWGVPALRTGPAIQAAIKRAVNTRRASPKQAIDKLRGGLGFVRSFDAVAWESTCGFEIVIESVKGPEDVGTDGSSSGEAGTGRRVVGGPPGRPVPRAGPSRVDRPDGTPVVGDDGPDDLKGRRAAEQVAAMTKAMRDIDGVVSNTFGPLSQTRKFSVTCPVCRGELKVLYSGPRAIRAACVTDGCLRFMS